MSIKFFINTEALLCLLLVFIASIAFAQVPRTYHGAKYEPVAHVLHGAGQNSSGSEYHFSFLDYGEVMGKDRYPLVYMYYVGMGTSLNGYTKLKGILDEMDKLGYYVIPQIGVNWKAEDVPSDELVNVLCEGIKLLDRPVYLRLGYEFNGPWMGFIGEKGQELFKESFIKITKVLREQDVQAATVWCAAIGTQSKWEELEKYYPGDEYVDWFSLDLFSMSEITHEDAKVFTEKAKEHNKPVMIGEATPRWIPTKQHSLGAQAGAVSWDGWFHSFFNFIKEHSNVKAHTYINWDWSPFEQWKDWGDARLELDTAEYVRTRYIEEISNPIFLHATKDKPDYLEYKSK